MRHPSRSLTRRLTTSAKASLHEVIARVDRDEPDGGGVDIGAGAALGLWGHLGHSTFISLDRSLLTERGHRDGAALEQTGLYSSLSLA